MNAEENHEKKVSEKKSPAKSVSAAFKKFMESIEKCSNPEEKLTAAIEWMREALADPAGPRLKDFWDGKHLCTELFKESLAPPIRSRFWEEYTALNQEARRLKEIMDEQTAFSIEQIELAIKALEKDIGHYDELIRQIPQLEFPKNTHKLLKKEEVYKSHQRELHFLKTLVSRLDGLRKETIQTDMRISIKNKLLKRLAKLGDQVFPKRKELIKLISDQFIQDVEAFVSERFSNGENQKPVPPYVLRNEIKSFQALAKLLTLNTQAFTKTRNSLSQCWEKIKETESELKKDYESRAEEFKENKEKLLTTFKELETFVASTPNKRQLLDKVGAFDEEMKALPLAREDVKELRQSVQKLKSEALENIEAKTMAAEKAGKAKIETLKKELETLVQTAKKKTLEVAKKEMESLEEAYQKLTLSAPEKQQFDRLFLDLKSLILDKKEETATSIDELEEVLALRKEHLDAIRRQVKECRREMGGSSLDFEKAMTYRELYDSAKIHLDKEVEAVELLEDKMIEKDS